MFISNMKESYVSINELLHDAALKGDVASLRDLLSQDPLLLHRPSSTTNLLHIASKLGYLQFVEELLLFNPALSEKLDPTDRSSPLHLASGNGHVEVVKTLISTNVFMCLARDVQGRNPAHVAAMKGQVRVLEELLKAVPVAARDRVSMSGVGGGETIMHLCVKFNQLEALSVVANTVGDAGMLLNAADGDGNTILHIAVADKRLEIVHFLVNDNRVNKNILNGNGLTAMDIFIQDNNGRNRNPVLRFTLEEANVLRSKDINMEKERENEKEEERQLNWVENQRSALMVVASLVAAMAFQAGLSPPVVSLQVGHQKTDQSSHYYDHQFIIANTIGLLSSMSSVIMLISGLPGRRFFAVIVMLMMWTAVTSMTYVYGISMKQIQLQTNTNIHSFDLFSSIFLVWLCFMVLLLLGHLTTTCPRRMNSIRCM